MDYFKRKKLSMELVKKMINNEQKDADIVMAIEDTYQMSPLWTKKYMSRLRGEDV